MIMFRKVKISDATDPVGLESRCSLVVSAIALIRDKLGVDAAQPQYWLGHSETGMAHLAGINNT